MTQLDIFLLGPFQVTRDGTPVTTFKSNKDRALLSYLVVEAKRPHSREKLAALLWPDMPDRDARSNLRYTLSSLRRTIDDQNADPPFLLITRDTIQWNHKCTFTVDTSILFDLLLNNTAVFPNCNQLETVVQLHRGLFLEGFSLKDSLPFEEWLLLKREEFNRHRVDVLHQLIEWYEKNGRYTPALTHALTLVALEPWQEAVWRRIMRLQAYLGQREDALAKYQVCCHALETELGVQPESTTVWLYEQIRDGMLQRPHPPPAFLSDNGVRRKRPLFVNRKQELAGLAAGLHKAMAGQGHVLFINGEAGTGKTALINEFVRQAQDQTPDLLVAGGHGVAYTGAGDPYTPIYQLLDMLSGNVEVRWSVGDIDTNLARRLWQALPLLTTSLVSQGCDLIGSLVDGTPLYGRALAHPNSDLKTLTQLSEIIAARAELGSRTAVLSQHNLFEQVRRVLTAIAAANPLLLYFDDLQWADSGSISLLAHLGAQLAGHRILIVGAYRPEDVALGSGSNRHPLLSVVNQFRRLWGDITIGLAQTNGRSFVDAILDAEPNRLSPQFRDMFCELTQGHPLFTMELLHGMQTGQDLMLDEDGRWLEGPSLNWQTMPPRVESAIGERVNRLPEPLHKLLAVAAVEGETFTAEVVAQVQDIDPDEILMELTGTLTQIHRLVRAVGVERANGHPLARYRFSHNLIQRFLYTNLDIVQRTRLHETVGHALEKLYAVQPTEPSSLAARLAWHFDNAGLPEKAVTYYRGAAIHARQLSAHEEVIKHIECALTLLPELPAKRERDELEIELLLTLGSSAEAARGYAAPIVAQSKQRTLMLCQKSGDTPQLLPAMWASATYHYAVAEYPIARDLSAQIVTIANHIDDPVQQALAHWNLGMVLIHQGEFAAARETLTLPVRFFNPEKHHFLANIISQDPTVSSLVWMGWALWFLGYPEQATDHCRRAIKLAEQLQHPFSLAFAMGVGGDLFHSLGLAFSEAATYAERLRPFVQKEGFSQIAIGGIISQGLHKSEAGKHEEGIQLLHQGIEQWQATGARHMVTHYMANLVRAYGLAHQTERGLATANEALALVAETGERYVEAELYRLIGELYLQQNEEHLAELSFENAITIAQRQQAKMWELRATTSLCRLWISQQKKQDAFQQLSSIILWFNEGRHTPDLQDANRLTLAP